MPENTPTQQERIADPLSRHRGAAGSTASRLHQVQTSSWEVLEHIRAVIAEVAARMRGSFRPRKSPAGPFDGKLPPTGCLRGTVELLADFSAN